MKKIACSSLGGPAECSTVITGTTSEEMIASGWAHLESTHSELAENIKGNPKEVNDKWMADFAANFDNLEDATEDAA